MNHQEPVVTSVSQEDNRKREKHSECSLLANAPVLWGSGSRKRTTVQAEAHCTFFALVVPRPPNAGGIGHGMTRVSGRMGSWKGEDLQLPRVPCTIVQLLNLECLRQGMQATRSRQSTSMSTLISGRAVVSFQDRTPVLTHLIHFQWPWKRCGAFQRGIDEVMTVVQTIKQCRIKPLFSVPWNSITRRKGFQTDPLPSVGSP